HDGHKLTKGHVGCGAVPAALAVAEAEDRLDGDALLTAVVLGYEIGSRVLRDPRPFHPQRLWDVYNTYLGIGIYRSKGFFWLPTRDRLVLLWNQTGGNVGLEIVNYWKITALEDGSLNLADWEKDAMRDKLVAAHPDFGDRRCQLTIIGKEAELDAFVNALKGCFCTGEEIAAWKAGASFDDPWPKTVATLSAGGDQSN
ncbi:MAG: GTP-binding protein, partial [Pseudomonadota bacterium]